MGDDGGTLGDHWNSVNGNGGGEDGGCRWCGGESRVTMMKMPLRTCARKGREKEEGANEGCDE